MCCFLAYHKLEKFLFLLLDFYFLFCSVFYQSEGAVYLSWLLSETHEFSQMLKAITFSFSLCFLCAHLLALHSGRV